MNTWKNKNGESINIKDMNTEYIKNAIAFVDRKAKEGVDTYIRIESDTDSYYTTKQFFGTVYGKEVKEYFSGYENLKTELKERLKKW